MMVRVGSMSDHVLIQAAQRSCRVHVRVDRLAAVLVSGILAAAVGTAQAAAGGTGAAPSTAKFSSGLDAICASASASANAIGVVKTLSDLTAKGPRLIAVDTSELNQLIAIGPPPASLVPAVNRYVVLQRQIDALEHVAMRTARYGHSASVVQALKRAETLNSDESSDLRTIGALSCLSSVSLTAQQPLISAG